MPNYRAVSAGAIPPPPTPTQAFKIATQQSFDYSSFIFVGITSLMAEASDAHPQLGHGIDGFGRYYWRGFLDKADGNYLVIFALPTVLHEDKRYYAMGTGRIWKRGIYAASRIPSRRITMGTTPSTLPRSSAAVWHRLYRRPITPRRTAPPVPSRSSMDGRWGAMP